MVKQGKFSQINQVKFKKNNIVKHQLKQFKGTISENQIADFLTTRYYLVNKNKMNLVVQETMLRFLNILIDQFINKSVWELSKGLENSLELIGNQVPWQFYYVLSSQKYNLIKFLKKEVPAIPLDKQLIVIDISFKMFDEIIAQHLALNWFTEQFKNRLEKLQQVQIKQIYDLKYSILNENGLIWESVRLLYLNQDIINNEKINDLQTCKWIDDLQKINI